MLEGESAVTVVVRECPVDVEPGDPGTAPVGSNGGETIGHRTEGE